MGLPFALGMLTAVLASLALGGPPGLAQAAVFKDAQLEALHEAAARGEAIVFLERALEGRRFLVGDAFDVLWRANRRNVLLLREWLDHERRR